MACRPNIHRIGNLDGVIHATQAVLPTMIAQHRGHIFSLTSRAACHDWDSRGILSYAVAKAGVERLTSALAEEATPHGVIVNCLDPVSLRSSGAVAARGADADWSSYDETDSIGEKALFLSTCDSSFTGRRIMRTDPLPSAGSLAAG